nr:hypothetical protein [Tanacetum cinerariifolium]
MCFYAELHNDTSAATRIGQVPSIYAISQEENLTDFNMVKNVLSPCVLQALGQQKSVDIGPFVCKASSPDAEHHGSDSIINEVTLSLPFIVGDMTMYNDCALIISVLSSTSACGNYCAYP